MFEELTIFFFKKNSVDSGVKAYSFCFNKAIYWATIFWFHM